MLTIVAFVVALGLLIAIHEYGHYRVAVACGVKVLRFSVGFGRPLLRWQPKGSPTEFVLGAFPLGGYVKMLDEREAPVAAEERHLAFNTQTLPKRTAIVAAGPLANLLLAVLLYAIVNWSGVEEPKAILASPSIGSIAEKAGVQGGETVTRAGWDGEALDEVMSFDDLRWLLTRGALDGRDVRLELVTSEQGARREVLMPLATLQAAEADAQLFRTIGVLGPWTRPLIGDLVADGAGARSGLQRGDLVQQVGAVRIVDGQQLRETIRGSLIDGQPVAQVWRIERDGRMLDLSVTPDAKPEGLQSVGRIGAYVGAPPAMLTIRYGVWDGIWRGVERTWEVSGLTLRMMGRMLVGEASIKNLSGPLSVAEYAGKSASLGFTQYLVFLALISVSLGVLNLLPVPMLDGGHLLYYLWEAVTGKSVSDAWMERLQRGGGAVLLVMMSIALFNDVNRLFG
ncbi:regulator of sigma E protease [Rhodoferax ferrireducens]|uniref:Zinc metalloprotease n=1 Tax=Rhodoferax ferrireducens TaxID=192843 RepID=A0ABU2C393_9BURK|nr:RIP metalloprotease RseP [Rhodoferax ferrireducens]MDR7375806.1 regulator of sigma E protease [Rhodoferax ferrireducens]